jgi:hypothetical protein
VDNACQRYRNLRRAETGALAQVALLKRSVNRAGSGICCAARVRKWPVSEATAVSRGGRSLGYTRRRGDAADRRWLRQPDAGQQLATLVSGIEASSSMPATKLGGGNPQETFPQVTTRLLSGLRKQPVQRGIDECIVGGIHPEACRVSPDIIIVLSAATDRVGPRRGALCQGGLCSSHCQCDPQKQVPPLEVHPHTDCFLASLRLARAATQHFGSPAATSSVTPTGRHFFGANGDYERTKPG